MRVVATLLVAGCHTVPAVCADPGAPAVELGQGAVTFEPVVDGGTFWFVQGPQGGWHVYGAARTTDLAVPDTEDFTDPDNVRFSFAVARIDGSRLAGFDDLPRVLTPTDDGHAELLGERLILDITGPPEVEGIPVTVTVSATDVCRTVTDARSGTLHAQIAPTP